MEWYLAAWRKYAQFTGRSQRSEFWFYVLFTYLIGFAFGLLTVLLHLGFVGLVITRIYILVTIIPSLAVTARRLHDTGRSGWWQLIHFVPLIGLIVMLVFLCQDSEPGENQYGPNPKEAG